ncbi:MAG: 50S ribosomal protein L3 [Bdellovibrionota bacterium]|jgi:large subunit ribosomal protein L3
MSSKRLYPEGLLGKKLGMTHVTDDEGKCIPVTVVEVGPCYVLAVRSQESNGYSAVQLGFGSKKQQRVNKAAMGHFAKAGRGAFYHVNEIRCDVEKLGWKDLGQEIRVAEVFNEGELVDITGTSIGRGFAGVVKRHGMKGQPATRGTHEYRRHSGAVGCRKDPGRVIPGHPMAGQKGNETVTVQNLKVIAVRPEENLILVRGGIPGSKGGLVTVRKAVKGYGVKAA